MGFPLVLKSATLNDVMAIILHDFTEFGSFHCMIYGDIITCTERDALKRLTVHYTQQQTFELCNVVR